MFKKYNKIIFVSFLSIIVIIIGFFPSSVSAEYEWTYQTYGSETSDNWFFTNGTNFVDQEGNSYSSGIMYSPGSVDFNGDAEGGILTLEEGSNPYPYILKLDKDKQFLWVKKISNVLNGTTNYSYISSISIDSTEDSIYMTGEFNGEIDFDPENTGGELTTSPVNFLNFVVKMSSNGDFLWAKKIGAESQGSTIINLDVDSSGNAYVAGSFSGVADFDQENEGGELTSSSGSGFILKLNTNGEFVWVKAFNSLESPQKYSEVYYIRADNSGNLLVTGSAEGETDLDLGDGIYSAGGGFNTGFDFILKLNNNGELIWSKLIRTTTEGDSQNYAHIKYLNNSFNDEDLYVSGNFAKTIYIDGEEQSYLISNNSSTDIFIYKLDNSTGDYIWSKSFGGIDRDSSDTATIDKLDNLYVFGTFKTSIDFDPENDGGELTTSSPIEIPYMLKLDEAGEFVWAKKIDGEGLTTVDWIYPYISDSDGDNNIYVNGYFSGKPVEGKTYDFNPGSPDEVTGIMTSYALEESFLIKISADIVIITPSISEPSVNNITRTSAVINSSVTDSGGEEPSTVGFQYGSDTSYGSTVTSNNIAGSFSHDFSGSLSCDTIYHFRAFAENSAGIKYSNDNLFTTEECPSRSRVTGSSAKALTKFFAQQTKETPTVIGQPTTYNFGTTLIKQGQRNNFVKELQKYLNINLNLKLTEDGIFGPMTKSAVILFQKNNNLTPDGLVGPATKGKMK